MSISPQPAPAAEPASAEPTPADAPNRFAELGLAPGLLKALVEAGFEDPTPVQEQAIPPLLAKRDIVGQAQTGTGKTAAFGLPLLQQIDLHQRTVQGLILAPTRELAVQVAEALKMFGGQLPGLRITAIYGGQPIGGQLRALSAGSHVVVGTPGRVIDCIDRGALQLDRVGMLVLDEADEMLRMGFLEDVEKILSKVNPERQTALFSATMPGPIAKVAESYLKDPIRVTIESKERSVAGVEQRVVLTQQRQKLDVLTRVLEACVSDSVLVFARTKASCADLADALCARGFSAAALHGDMSQAQRDEVVRQLRARRIDLLVATDVAARGLDVDGISHVINFDPPMDAETYLHRIGRTGRAGREGVAILMLTRKEQWLRRSFERYTRQEMVEMGPPTNADIEARRIERFEQQVRTQLETEAAEDNSPYRAVLERLLEETGIEPVALATALARLATGSKPLSYSEPEPVSSGRYDAPAPRERSGGGGGSRGRDDGPMTRLFLSLGSRARLRPGDLVGAIANELDIPGKAIGAIDIRESSTFFDVATEHEAAVLGCSGSLSIRGQTVRIDKARPGSGDDRPRFSDNGGPRRSFNRDDRGGRPSFNRDDRGGRPSFNRDDRGGRPSFNRDDRGGRPSFNRDDRGGRPSFNRDDRGGRPSFNRDDRGGRPSFNRDDRGGRPSFNRDDRGGRPSFNRDDRGGRPSFNRDDRGGRPSFNRDDRGGRPSFNRDDRGGRPSFNRDDRPPIRFNRDDRSPKRFDRESKPFSSGSNDGGPRPFGRFGSDEERDRSSDKPKKRGDFRWKR